MVLTTGGVFVAFVVVVSLFYSLSSTRALVEELRSKAEGAELSALRASSELANIDKRVSDVKQAEDEAAAALATSWEQREQKHSDQVQRVTSEKIALLRRFVDGAIKDERERIEVVEREAKRLRERLDATNMLVGELVANMTHALETDLDLRKMIETLHSFVKQGEMRNAKQQKQDAAADKTRLTELRLRLAKLEKAAEEAEIAAGKEASSGVFQRV